jgi:hypothetical protein
MLGIVNYGLDDVGFNFGCLLWGDWDSGDLMWVVGSDIGEV